MIAEFLHAGGPPLAADDCASAIVTALDSAGMVVIPKADLFGVVEEQERLRSALRLAGTRMWEARRHLTPGMRAGTAAACSLLDVGVNEARTAAPAAGQKDAPA